MRVFFGQDIKESIVNSYKNLENLDFRGFRLNENFVNMRSQIDQVGSKHVSRYLLMLELSAETLVQGTLLAYNEDRLKDSLKISFPLPAHNFSSHPEKNIKFLKLFCFLQKGSLLVFSQGFSFRVFLIPSNKLFRYFSHNRMRFRQTVVVRSLRENLFVTQLQEVLESYFVFLTLFQVRNEVG